MLGSRRQILCLATVLALAGTGAFPAAQPQPSRATDQEVKHLLTRIEKNAEQFRRSLAQAPDRGWIVGGKTARNIDHFVTGFVDATRRLRAHFDRGQVVTAGVDEVLRRGVSIDSFMERNRSADQAAHDWATVRRDLEALAVAFNVPWNPATPRLTGVPPDTSPPSPPLHVSLESRYADQTATRSGHRPTRRGIDRVSR
jgi:hypothetical protein